MLREDPDLRMGHPLDVEVVAPGPLVIISLREDAVTEGPRPRRPGGALPLARGPEAGVVLDLRMARDQPPKTRPPPAPARRPRPGRTRGAVALPPRPPPDRPPTPPSPQDR